MSGILVNLHNKLHASMAKMPVTLLMTFTKTTISPFFVFTTNKGGQRPQQRKIMTDYNDHSKLKHDSISNMDALEISIVNGEEERLKMLLTDIVFDEIQKSYLISLAIHSGNKEIVKILKGSPATL